MDRQAEITLDAGCEVKLLRFRSRERLGELFEIDAEIVAAEKADFLASLGKPVLIEIFEARTFVRALHAQLVEAHFLGEEAQGYRYSLKLMPWLSALASNRNYRVFEDMTGLDIIREILSDHGRHVDYSRVTGRYLPRPYTTQYRESDFAFLSRIMEREGLYYYFEHRRDDHVLVLCDTASAHRPVPGQDVVKLRPDRGGETGGLNEALHSWHEHVRASGELRVRFQSFDPATTSAKTGRVDGEVRHSFESQEVYEFTGDFVDEGLASHWARVMLEAARARQRVYSGEGDMIRMACGCGFELDSTDAFGRGNNFIVTMLDIEMDAEPYRSGAEAKQRVVRIEAVTRNTQWRSPIATPAPRAGPETAVVIAGGADDLDVDAAGRVRVRFQWGKTDEAADRSRSCWLRISQSSAGAALGHVTLPRQDEEVIVDFLDGNPDRPIVTGRVHNSKHVHPHALPDHRTRSVFRSQTIGQAGDYGGAERPPPPGTGFNELRFEDKGGAEEVYLRAQRNRTAEIFLDDETWTGRDRKTRIGRDRSTEVRGDERITVEEGDYALSAVRGSASIEAAQKIEFSVGANSLVIDETGITIRAGLSTITLNESGIAASGLTITSDATTVHLIKGALTTVASQGLLTLTGKPPLIS